MYPKPPPGARLICTCVMHVYTCGCSTTECSNDPEEGILQDYCQEHEPASLVARVREHVGPSAQQARRDRAYIETHDFPF